MLHLFSKIGKSGRLYVFCNIFSSSQRHFPASTSQKHEFYYTSHFKNPLLEKVEFLACTCYYSS
ncbi:MAG: hypothetical protein Q8P62_04805, partial [Candidatus Peregrinibacteria bacterium]|nr:hypothetical protein [Candidatus Peregrinibacteria bacterium]